MFLGVTVELRQGSVTKSLQAKCSTVENKKFLRFLSLLEETTELWACNILYNKCRHLATKHWQVCRYVWCNHIFHGIETFFGSSASLKKPKQTAQKASFPTNIPASRWNEHCKTQPLAHVFKKILWYKYRFNCFHLASLFPLENIRPCK